MYIEGGSSVNRSIFAICCDISAQSSASEESFFAASVKSDKGQGVYQQLPASFRHLTSLPMCERLYRGGCGQEESAVDISIGEYGCEASDGRRRVRD